MSDSSALRFAVCTLSRSGALPLAELQLDTAIADLANQRIEAHSFAREFELIAKYSDILRPLEEEKRKEQESASQKSSEKPPAVVEESFLGAAGSAGGASLVNTDVYRSSSPDTRVDSREAAVLEMMQQTGEQRDACFFYLESMGWDLKAALELFQSMAIR